MSRKWKRLKEVAYYLCFLKVTLDEMDKYPEIKGRYHVTDNAPIHNSADIRKYIHSRGYRCVYLDKNEEFWLLCSRRRMIFNQQGERHC